MLSSEENSKWLKENATDVRGNIRLKGLDFRGAKGNFIIEEIQLDNSLLIQHSDIGGDITLCGVNVGRDLFTNAVNAKRNIYQSYQVAGGSIDQHENTAGVDLRQTDNFACRRMYLQKRQNLVKQEDYYGATYYTPKARFKPCKLNCGDVDCMKETEAELINKSVNKAIKKERRERAFNERLAKRIEDNFESEVNNGE